jgi:DNA-binding MarR family transcriptional regulator
MLQENLERNFGFILNDVARLLRKVYDRRVRELGLTRAQWWVLTHLYRVDGVTQAELAEILEIERPTLGRLLDRLEAKGWVRREPDADDRRAKRVFLTEAVQAPMQTMRAVAASVRSDALSGLSATEQDRFVDALLKIKGNLLGLEDGGSNNGGNRGRRRRTR